MLRIGLIFIFCFLPCHSLDLVENAIKDVDKEVYVHDPDVYKTTSELILDKGYLVEEYNVTTLDSYILTMQRIPCGRDGNSQKSKKDAVLLMHGLTEASSDWVINFAEQSLAYILAEAGYDVWLGNSRGNPYGRKHKYLSPDQPEFWDFSFDDIAAYDIPVMIDHVLDVTGADSIYSVHHSLASAEIYAFLSENPEYNEKIKLAVCLAPIAHVGYMKHPVVLLAPYTDIIYTTLGNRGVFEIDEFRPLISRAVCETPARFMCEAVYAGIGFDITDMNTTRLGVYVNHFPAGASLKTFAHIGQMINSKKFQKFDYGKDNRLYYNQDYPPEYDLSRIKAPVALVTAELDLFSDPEDVALLKKELTSLVSDYIVPSPTFSHLDYTMGLKANDLVYDHVLQLLKKY